MWEDQRLIEPALGGPDTATRVQTAWQVKALSGVPADACTDPTARRAGSLIAPSTARMTAGGVGGTAPGGTVRDPAGRRLHRAGEPAVPGRDPRRRDPRRREPGDVQVVARQRVARRIGAQCGGAGSPPPLDITVESTGRDTWMRFEVSQQVELLDDDIELAMRESGTGGIMAKVIHVNHATGEITSTRI